MRESSDVMEFWGFVLGFVFSLFGILGVAKLTDGDTRRFMLHSAFDGALASLICVGLLIVFVIQF